jgi:hypothetical protein
MHTVKRNKEDLVVVSKKNGIEVHSDKTQCMAMYRDQNSGRSHTIKTGNSSLERVEEFKYLGKP